MREAVQYRKRRLRNKICPGGLGGKVSADRPLIAKDAHILEKAIRQRWDIPPEMRGRVPEVLSGIVNNPDASERNRIAAARALIAADAQNMDQEQMDTGQDAQQADSGLTVNIVTAIIQQLHGPAPLPAPAPERVVIDQ